MKFEYFAAGEPDKIVTYVEERCLGITRRRSDYWSMLRRNFHAYYSNNLFGSDFSHEDTSLKFRGERGEMIKMSVNQSRTLTKQFMAIAGKQRLSFDTIAATTEDDILQSSRLENAVAENIVTDKNIDILADNSLETALVLGASFVAVTWDQGKGYPIGADMESGKMLMSGDVHFEVFTPFDVFYDQQAKAFQDLDWIVLRRRVNRADLIAQHPEKRKELEKASEDAVVDSLQAYLYNKYDEDKTMISVYEFYHRPTSAMPSGRLCAYIDKNCVVFDGPNPYECIPVSPMMPEPVINTLIGYPMYSELMPAQEMLDSSFSTVASNQAAFGVQSVLIPKGSDINVSSIGSVKFIQFTPQNAQGGGKPEPLQLTRTPPEIFTFADSLHKHLVEISGLNGAVRGTPPAGVTSGIALSALATNAIEFAQSATRAYTICWEHAMLLAMKTLKKFASEEMLVYMVGEQKETLVKSFKAGDLREIYKVKLRVSNPLAKTAGGRITMTEQMLSNGLIKTPEDYFAVLMTGNIEQVMEDSLDEQSLMRRENAMLMKGGLPPAISIDKHAEHILTHRSILFNPKVRTSSTIAANVLAHINEHVRLAKETDPVVLAIIATGQIPQGLPPEQGAPPPQAAPALEEALPEEVPQEMAPPGELETGVQ